MIARFLALALTLFIGSPVCWCCIACSETGSPGKDDCPMCREGSAESPEERSNEKPCPCSHGCQARELTNPELAVAAAAAAHSPPPLWAAMNERWAPAGRGFADLFPVREAGPPRPHVPLYQQHCALLL